ncbi:helix-turn-helix domain-containing protein [Lonsdalea iberica]|nr:helix-turn-helix transcriptional regulator [Lonsdalea iberica]
MNFDSLCAQRLKSERSRLALKQGEAAARCGVSREMWSKYERGVAVPGGDVFAAFAQSGANVQFILTGEQGASSETRAGALDAELLAKIVLKLEMLAKQAGRRWTSAELVLQSAKIYNFLIKEPAIDNDRIDSVLKLVINR